MATHNLTIWQGQDWSYQVLYKDADGVAIDLTGYTAKMQIRKSPGGALIHTLSTELGTIAITGSLGKLVLTISDTDTAAFAFDLAYYDLFITSGGGETLPPLLDGTVELNKRVTEL